MKKFIFGTLFVVSVAIAVFAAPYYTTLQVWCPSVTGSTSTFLVADNVYIKDIKFVNFSTGMVTFGLKASSAIVDYFPVGKDGTYTLEVNEKWSAVTTYIDMTHISSNAWTVTSSSVNLIGVLYRYRP